MFKKTTVFLAAAVAAMGAGKAFGATLFGDFAEQRDMASLMTGATDVTGSGTSSSSFVDNYASQDKGSFTFTADCYDDSHTAATWSGHYYVSVSWDKSLANPVTAMLNVEGGDNQSPTSVVQHYFSTDLVKFDNTWPDMGAPGDYRMMFKLEAGSDHPGEYVVMDLFGHDGPAGFGVADVAYVNIPAVPLPTSAVMGGAAMAVAGLVRHLARRR